MEYYECKTQRCRFYSPPQEAYCLNCGARNPHYRKPKKIADSTDSGKKTFFQKLFGGLSSSSSDEVMPPSQPLIERVRIIRQRIDEIERRQTQLELVRLKAKLKSGEEWKSLIQVLEDTQASLDSLRTSYQFKLGELGLLHWQNRLMGAFFNLENLSSDEIRNHLKEIEEDRKVWVGVSLDAEMSIKYRKQTFSLEVKVLVDRINETLKSSYKIHDALLARKAVIVLKDIAPLKDALHPVSSAVDTIRGLEVFNIQVALTNFSASFNELEAEYVRIKSEEDVASQLKQVFEGVE